MPTVLVLEGNREENPTRLMKNLRRVVALASEKQ